MLMKLLRKIKHRFAKQPVTPPALISDRTLDILIWGCNDFSSQLHKLLAPTNINIVGYVHHSADIKTFCGKPVYSIAEFKNKTGFSHLPMIVSVPHHMSNHVPTVDFETIRQFKIQIQQIAFEHGIENLLLHPAALVDYLKLDHSSKVVTFGLPGSGNTIFNHILQKIQAQRPTTCTSVRFFEQLCYEYTQIIHQVITDVIYSCGGHRVHIGPWKLGTTHFDYLYQQQSANIFSFKTRDHIICSNYGYHALPDKQLYDYLKARQFKCFFIMRNPLDMILSNIKKFGCLNAETKHIRNVGLFLKKSDCIITLLSRWHDANLGMPELRYESLIENPIEYILHIMQSLECPPDPDFARSVWNELGFKELPHVPKNHFWKGGAGKWENYFNYQSLASLKAYGMEALLEKYNYLSTLERFKQLCQGPDGTHCPHEENARFELLESDYGFNSADTLKYVDFLYNNSHAVHLEHLHIGSSHSEHAVQIKEILNNRFIKLIVHAGAHPEYRTV